MSDHVSALERLEQWLRDDGFGVTIEGTTLYAAKNPGVFYRNLSPVDRLTRGALLCWFDGGRLRLKFRPDWFPALVDAGLIAIALAVWRAVGPPTAGSRRLDAAIAFLAIAAVLPFLMPMVRLRFDGQLERAISSSDDAWQRVRRRGVYWRWAWKLGAVGVVGWTMTRILRWLEIERRTALNFRNAFHLPSAVAVRFLGIAVLTSIVTFVIWHFVTPRLSNQQRD